MGTKDIIAFRSGKNLPVVCRELSQEWLAHERTYL
jgi:hypothetical protein